MPITPDTKNWTWVLERPCPECGFEAAAFDRAAAPALVRENAQAWVAVLAGDAVRSRPSDDMWSPLEYGCHVRDVYRICDGRLLLMLETDDPTYPNWDQDATAADDAYDTQDPAQVAAELTAAAAQFAERIAAVREVEWTRPGTRSDGSRFTVESLVRYAIHDPVHHLADVEPAGGA